LNGSRSRSEFYAYSRLRLLPPSAVARASLAGCSDLRRSGADNAGEAGTRLLYLCSSLRYRETPQREACMLTQEVLHADGGRESRPASSGWLSQHLEEFVRPRLGFVPPVDHRFLSPEQMTVVKSVWRAAKRAARGKMLVLPGRDVWVFEVLARREGFPTIFDPRCSRQTCQHREYRDRFDPYFHILLDTGFVGSIAKALSIDCILISADNRAFSAVRGKQAFPNLTGARNLALFLESLPKYWTSGIVVGGEIKQKLTAPIEFTRAAMLTQKVYKDSSPRSIESRNPLKAGRYERVWVTM